MSEAEGDNFYHASSLVLQTFISSWSASALFPPSMALALTGARLDNTTQLLHTVKLHV